MRVTTLVVQPTILFLSDPSPSPSPSILLCQQPPPLSVRVAFSSSSEQEGKREAYKVPTPKREWVAEWVWQNDEAVRQMPVWVGAISLLAVLINRVISGIAPVSNASSFCCRTKATRPMPYDDGASSDTDCSPIAPQRSPAIAVAEEKLVLHCRTRVDQAKEAAMNHGRAAWLPRKSPPEKPATSFEPEMEHVHPKMPGFDSLAARIAMLRGGHH